MTRRPMIWVIVDDGRDGYSVLRGGRPVTTGMSSLGSAETVVRRNRIGGEKVFLVEPDGYRTELTKKFADPDEVPSRARRRGSLRR